MLKVIFTNNFKKNYEQMKKRRRDMTLADNVIRELSQGKALPRKYKDHALTGGFKGYRECHIQPDWLLIYYIKDGVIYFTHTGAHSDLF